MQLMHACQVVLTKYIFPGLGRENMAALAAIHGNNSNDNMNGGEGEVPFEQEVLMDFVAEGG